MGMGSRALKVIPLTQIEEHLAYMLLDHRLWHYITTSLNS